MRKIKLLLVSLLSLVCVFVFSSCGWIVQGIYAVAIYVGVLVDTISPKPQDLPTEIVEELTITEVEQDEDGSYVVTVEGAIKNAGDADSDSIWLNLSFYDENGYVLDTASSSFSFIGAGETLNVCEDFYYFDIIPTSVKVRELTMKSKILTSGEEEKRAKVELLSEGTLSCVLGEDGLYHTTVTGKVKLLEDDNYEIMVRTALYDTDGYLHLAEWSKSVLPNEEREYVIEYVSKEEIVSHKLLYGTVYSYLW